MSLFKRIGGGQSATLGGSKRGASTKVGNVSKSTGRQGAGGNAASNATSDVFQFSYTLSAANSQTFVLTSDTDWIAADWAVTVTVGGAYTGGSSDILGAISNILVIASDGPCINITPVPDFYMLQQRFSPYGVSGTVVNASASGSAYTGYYHISGFNLPQAKGPYSMIISTPAAATFNASATSLTVLVSLSLKSGTAKQRLRTQFSGLPFTPAASGTNDLAPLAPIQDISLTELMFSSMTSNTADISTIQLMSQGSVLGPRTLAGTLVSRQANELTGAVASSELYPLLALQSNLTLGRNAHMYITWGASPSSTIRLLFVWFD